jgi:hypothetical protein
MAQLRHPALPLSWALAALAFLQAVPAAAIGSVRDYLPPSSVLRTTVRPEPWSISPGDASRIARGRALSISADLGDSVLIVRGARMRGTRIDDDAPDRIDRFALYEIGTETAIDLGLGFTLTGEGTFTLMSRRVALIEPYARPRQTFLARAGFAIRRGSQDRLSLEFVDVAPASTRSEAARISELLGGSPIAERGLRLAYSRRLETAGCASLRIGFSASAMDVTNQDAGILGGAGGMNRRASVSLDLGF